MIGFYVLALLIAGGLFAIPFAEIRYAERIDLRLTVFCVVAGFAIAGSPGSTADRADLTPGSTRWV